MVNFSKLFPVFTRTKAFNVVSNLFHRVALLKTIILKKLKRKYKLKTENVKKMSKGRRMKNYKCSAQLA